MCWGHEEHFHVYAMEQCCIAETWKKLSWPLSFRNKWKLNRVATQKLGQNSSTFQYILQYIFIFQVLHNFKIPVHSSTFRLHGIIQAKKFQYN